MTTNFKRLATNFIIVGGLFHGLLAPSTASAAFAIYTDRASFNAASTNLSTLTFEGLAPAGSFTYYGNPGSLTLNRVTFQTNGALFVQNLNYYGTGAFLSAQQAPQGPDILTVLLPSGINAIGTDFLSTTPVTVTLSTGQSYTLPGRPFPNIGFTGFTTDVAISSLRFSEASGIDLDNFSFGQSASVPEPSSVAMLLLGVVGVLGASVRAHRPEKTPAVRL